MPEPVRVLLTGRHGQLGQALVASVPAGLELIATGRGEVAGGAPADLMESEPLFRVEAGGVDHLTKSPVEQLRGPIPHEHRPRASPGDQGVDAIACLLCQPVGPVTLPPLAGLGSDNEIRSVVVLDHGP